MAIRRYQGDLLVEEWDAEADLYRQFNTLGDAVRERPLTDVELARVQRYDRAVAEAGAVDQAKQTVGGIQGRAGAFQQQLSADVATVQAGWATLDGATQTAIILRVLDGFTAVMEGLQAHAAVTGAIDPLAIQEAPA